MPFHFQLPIFFAALSLAVSGNALANDRFQMAGTSYSVEMPGSPDCGVHSIPASSGAIELHLCTYFDEQIARGYSIEYFALPATVSPAHSSLVLKATMNGAATNSGSKIVEEKELIFAGYPALEAVFLKGGFFAYIRYVFTTNHLITVTVDGGKKPEQSKPTSRFLHSFRVEP